MKGFAVTLDAAGVHAIDPVAACARADPRPDFVWVHLDGREPDTIGWLGEHGGMPDTVPYALTATETRPRCEPIDHGALVNLRGPAAEGAGDDTDELVSIRSWLEAGRAITVSMRPMTGLEPLRRAMDQGRIKDPGDLVSQLAILITKQLDPAVADLGDLVDTCETSLDAKQAFETRRRIAAARSDAIGYRRFVVPQREALGALATLDVDWLQDDDRLHLREAADRFARMAEELEAVRERAALIHEQLTDLRSELIENRALTLSIVALIFLPLTFLTGLLGMNVDGIPFAHDPWAFPAVCGLCLAVAAGVTGWFAARHWFGR